MGKTFLIDSRIVFDCERNELYVLNQPELLKETLNEPCARCLEALLSSPGEIITQAELYTAGWGNDDREVSPNTLYQNILLARKALKSVSESNTDFIITLPRKGFKFNDAISVTIPDTANDINHGRDKNLSYENKAIANVSPSMRLLSEKLNTFILPLSGLFIIIAFGIFIFSLYKYNKPYHQDITNAYQLSLEKAGCKIYINKREMINKTETQKLTETWPPLISDCTRYPNRYVSLYRQHFRIFYLSCSTQNETNRTCKTGYFRP